MSLPMAFCFEPSSNHTVAQTQRVGLFLLKHSGVNFRQDLWVSLEHQPKISKNLHCSSISSESLQSHKGNTRYSLAQPPSYTHREEMASVKLQFLRF